MSEASDRLALSRLAIIEHVHRRNHPEDYDRVTGEPKYAAPEVASVGLGKGEANKPEDTKQRREQKRAEAEPGPAGASARAARAQRWIGGGRRAVSTWWRRHPANLGLQVATPMLSAIAGRHPALYLGTAAVIGAVIVVARPWRLMSVTGLAIAILKSGQLSGMVASAMSAANYGRDDGTYQ